MPPLIALAGNPNVGKSTLFNALTGLRQHTGNWTGKTVETALGTYTFEGQDYRLADLPGTYSLADHSPEETAARQFIESGRADGVVVVCDATCPERTLILALQILEITGRVIVCLNLQDEARRLGIRTDTEKLSALLGIPVVGVSAGRKEGLEPLCRAMAQLPRSPDRRHPPLTAEERAKKAEQLAAATVSAPAVSHLRQQRLNRLLTSRATGIPLMLLLLGIVIWLTVNGANYPSALLSAGFERLTAAAKIWLRFLPPRLCALLTDGVLRVTGWVVSVMLPPMAIFFPLFTLLEDLGYLPRVAFVLDHAFQKARACGKQSLTMCMSLGCAACGITGCRIIDSPRERLIAILTSSLVPCNGKFPTLIALITVFLVGGRQGPLASLKGSALLMGALTLGAGGTLLCSRLLSATVLRGMPSSFVLELPPFRRPQIGKILVRSVFDRTLLVLRRAVSAAAPAGAVIWCMANLTINGATLLSHCAGFFHPFARLFGLDGTIFTAFLLGWPANEIVVPVMLMAYLAQGAPMELESFALLGATLQANGWTWVTAVCVMLFSLFHWPCATACITVWKETGSLRWTLLSAALPTALGLALCFAVAAAARLFGIM